MEPNSFYELPVDLVYISSRLHVGVVVQGVKVLLFRMCCFHECFIGWASNYRYIYVVSTYYCLLSTLRCLDAIQYI